MSLCKLWPPPKIQPVLAVTTYNGHHTSRATTTIIKKPNDIHIYTHTHRHFPPIDDKTKKPKNDNKNNNAVLVAFCGQRAKKLLGNIHSYTHTRTYIIQSIDLLRTQVCQLMWQRADLLFSLCDDEQNQVCAER